MDAKVATDLKKISLLKTLIDRKTSSSGFSLLEVLVVMGILAFVIAFGLPTFRKPQNNIKTVTRQMGALSREVRHQARIKKMTHRIVIRLGGENGNVYWVESAPGNILIPSEMTLEKLQDLDEKERPASPFQKATKLIKDERELPSGLFFGSVETPNTPEPLTDGTAFVYYTPEGMVERAVIQITNRKELTWSLIFNPITGHADIVEKPIRLKDLAFE